MPLLTVDDLHLAFGARRIFDGDSLAVEPGDRLGVVGPNGTGKSTLLKIMAGSMTPDGGQVSRARGIRVGYLAQEHGDVAQGDLLQSVVSTAPGREAVQAQLAEAEAELASTDDVETQMTLSQRLADLNQELLALDQHYAPHHAQRILVGLGFTEADFGRPVSALSGGWRMRAALAALLFQRPDVMLLDEPTNHLDMPSVHWLDGFLSSVRQAVVLTCHDRRFLNRHISRVASLELDGLKTFKGNYDEYLEQRKLVLEYLEARSKKDEQRQKELEAFVTRFRAKASKARQAQSKAKQIEKLEAQRIDVPTIRRTMSVKFAEAPKSSDTVVRLEGLSFAYGSKPIFNNQDLLIRRGQRIALVGVNGAGKTTLLKLVAGELTPHTGDLQWGKNVLPSYFAQHHAESLSPDRTVIDEVWRGAPDRSQTDIRTLCGAFLFSGDDVEKPTGVLSGGERARVAMARMLARPANFLMLDEPTNHLDTESADRLTESLEAFQGTMLFVSHNLDFAKRLSDTVWDVRSGRVEVFPGSLDDYLDYLTEQQAELPGEPSRATAAVSTSKASRMQARAEAKAAQTEYRRKLKKLNSTIEKLETDIQTLETEQGKLEAQLADPETHTQPEKAKKLAIRYDKVKADLERAMDAWTEAEAEKESLVEPPRA
ncbi:MAG: ABC-F family ATP-binding cassette domain-containing protein [Myxococcota bacterium]